MAAEYFKQELARSNLSGVLVDSAGTLGIGGSPASAEAIVAMREVGVDLSPHRSQGISAELMGRADIVIAMTQRHLAELAARFPGPPERRWLLRAFEARPRPANRARDLKDPIGKPVEAYRKQVPVMARCLEHLARYLRLES